MPKTIVRTYSKYSREAMKLLGRMIRAGRKESAMTEQELATRAGVSRGLIQRIEKGDMKCEVGIVFEAAYIVGIPLFDANQASLANHVQQTESKLKLLPASIRKTGKSIDDDF
ncbi:MAG: helix-turn-helix transcriptional regulator [Rhodospirillales bacterium]|jgi:transcriptional regulator with XRE-family HTH domain|nr:helix-turn-helix transcriptional regulator [Rhodospirillales bacterium]MBT4040036.1 helix-turn-helix transcriptional regulator [Rhodospirillales bacterium]MBT4627865.1 helix-turn-helix transcriptional regulator [Rhodospirillales bacterium]MBT5351405.1 helix-turn-helix transcriptional regulator [Rhodospirillales bacterium]MBT5522006.1 helix-turn-helix transcriptional regulator [Rhodospirillales bacterium]